NLAGAVHAGPRSLPLTKTSFMPETGAISMEFDAEGNGGRTVHYTIDGKVSGAVMTGTWTHDNQHGDFRVTKQQPPTQCCTFASRHKGIQKTQNRLCFLSFLWL